MDDLSHDRLRQVFRDAGSSNPRIALAAIRLLEDDLDWLLVRTVRMARQQGYDWARIGRLLRRSRQSVRERFERLAPKAGPFPPHLRARTDMERARDE